MKLSFPLSTDDLSFLLEYENNTNFLPAFRLEIYGSGGICFFGIANVKNIGIVKDKIEQKKVLTLFEKLIEFDLLKIENNYVHKNVYEIKDNQIECLYEHLTDTQNTSLDINIGKIKKKIYNSYGAPQRLLDFQELMIKLSGANKWIKFD